MRVLAYTLSPWEHAIVNYRLSGPFAHAGWELMQGNLYKDVSLEQIPNADLIVIQRDFPHLISSFCDILDRADHFNIPVILDIDDLLFELPEDHPDQKIHYYTEALLPLLYAVQTVDAVTTTTKPMKKYLERINPRTFLLPNYLDDRVWNFEKVSSGKESGQIVIGYMGGDSHLPDLEPLKPVIEKILNRYQEKVIFHFIGCEPPGDLGLHPGVLWTPMREPDYQKFSQFIIEQHFDIAIAPLQDNLFNRCKSPAKFFEYSVKGIPGVYSRIAPYESQIEQGENGFLTQTLSDWERCLGQLIENPSLCFEMGKKAQERLAQNGLLSQHCYQWVETYSEIISGGKKKIEGSIPTDIFRSVGKQTQDWCRYLSNNQS